MERPTKTSENILKTGKQILLSGPGFVASLLFHSIKGRNASKVEIVERNDALVEYQYLKHFKGDLTKFVLSMYPGEFTYQDGGWGGYYTQHQL